MYIYELQMIGKLPALSSAVEEGAMMLQVLRSYQNTVILEMLQLHCRFKLPQVKGTSPN
jgi:hypothetical protein